MSRRMRFLAILAALAMIVAACGSTAGEDDDDGGDTGDDGATPTTTTTQAPAPSDDGGDDDDMMDFEPMSFENADCAGGGNFDSIAATGQYEVTFTMCSAVPAFLQIVAFTPFGIQPEEHLASSGGSPLDNPIGTGPFVLDSWNRGDSVVYSANDNYWGEAPAYDTLVFRWAAESASRLVELQSGQADYITNLATVDIEAVAANPDLTLLPGTTPNVLYLGFSNTQPPFDDLALRQALGKGIDRQRIIDNFYPPGASVPTHFTPCSIQNGCTGDAWYDYDASTARDELEAAGHGGLEVTLYYRDVFRVYLPEPGVVAQDIAEQLNENLGMNVSVQQVESGEFIAQSTQGEYAMYLLGWGADYPHVTNFLDFHFGEATVQFGDDWPEIYEPLKTAKSIADPSEAEALYIEANNAIRELVPMVPIAWGASADAARTSLVGAANPQFGAEQFEDMDPGKDTLVYVQNAEPISIFCADETDGESLSTCQQVVEPLLGYDLEGGVVPKLATECVGNDDATVWTCTLREGVVFHDGSSFDANDVVASFALGIDASSPLHVGNTGTFDYYAYLWGGLINEG